MQRNFSGNGGTIPKDYSKELQHHDVKMTYETVYSKSGKILVYFIKKVITLLPYKIFFSK